MELKLLRDDVHRITLELKERALKVEKLQAKYETLSSKARGAGDDDGEPKSQAYYVIKAAQEREELQREVRRTITWECLALVLGGCSWV